MVRIEGDSVIRRPCGDGVRLRRRSSRRATTRSARTVSAVGCASSGARSNLTPRKTLRPCAPGQAADLAALAQMANVLAMRTASGRAEER